MANTGREGGTMIRTRTVNNPCGLPIQVTASKYRRIGPNGARVSLRIRWGGEWGTQSVFKWRERDGTIYGLVAAVACSVDMGAVASLLDWFEENDPHTAEKIQAARAQGGTYKPRKRARLVYGEY